MFKWLKTDSKNLRRYEIGLALIVGCLVGFVVGGISSEWAVIKGAKWWDVMTAFGTVGAVVVAVTFSTYQIRDKKKYSLRSEAYHFSFFESCLDSAFKDALHLKDFLEDLTLGSGSGNNDLELIAIYAQDELIKLGSDSWFLCLERIERYIEKGEFLDGQKSCGVIKSYEALYDLKHGLRKLTAILNRRDVYFSADVTLTMMAYLGPLESESGSMDKTDLRSVVGQMEEALKLISP